MDKFSLMDQKQLYIEPIFYGKQTHNIDQKYIINYIYMKNIVAISYINSKCEPIFYKCFKESDSLSIQLNILSSLDLYE